MVIILNCSILDSLEKGLLLSAYNGNSLGSIGLSRFHTTYKA